MKKSPRATVNSTSQTHEQNLNLRTRMQQGTCPSIRKECIRLWRICHSVTAAALPCAQLVAL
eukprot:3897157-Amphidinium_carterae.1